MRGGGGRCGGAGLGCCGGAGTELPLGRVVGGGRLGIIQLLPTDEHDPSVPSSEAERDRITSFSECMLLKIDTMLSTKPSSSSISIIMRATSESFVHALINLACISGLSIFDSEENGIVPLDAE